MTRREVKQDSAYKSVRSLWPCIRAKAELYLCSVRTLRLLLLSKDASVCTEISAAQNMSGGTPKVLPIDQVLDSICIDTDESSPSLNPSFISVQTRLCGGDGMTLIRVKSGFEFLHPKNPFYSFAVSSIYDRRMYT